MLEEWRAIPGFEGAYEASSHGRVRSLDRELVYERIDHYSGIRIEELIRLTSAPVVLGKVTLGKHKGQQWADLPWDYLNWVAFKPDLGRDEKHTAKHYLGR